MQKKTPQTLKINATSTSVCHMCLFCLCILWPHPLFFLVVLVVFAQDSIVCFCGRLCWFVFMYKQATLNDICEATETVVFFYFSHTWHSLPFMSLQTLALFVFAYLLFF